MASWNAFADAELESRFIPPRSDLPHPEWWHSPDSESTECEVSEFVGGIVRLLQPELVVETGTAFGYTAWEIGRALTANGHGVLHTIELNQERLQHANTLINKAVQKGEIDSGRVVIVHGSSLGFDPPGPIDFAWFDSDLSLRATEFRRFHDLDLLAPGTIVAFHDCLPSYGIVSEHVRQLEADGLLKAIFARTPRGVCLAEVTR